MSTADRRLKVARSRRSQLIDSNALLLEVRYPDESTGEPGSTNQYKVRYSYNRLGELRSVTDQNGTVHVYGRDGAGRVTLDRVTAFGEDVDGFGADIDTRVDGIGIEYDGFGRVRVVESLDDTTVLNGVEFAYSPLWQVTAVYQNPADAASYDGQGDPTGETVVVRYAYSESASGNHSRPVSMTYPDGSLLTYGYGSAGSVDDRVSRVRSISLGPDAQNQTEVVAYSHVGLGLAAEVDYPVADVQLDRTASGDGKRRTQGFTTQAAGVYPGWDRFGRVARQEWVDGDYTQHGTTGGLPDRPPIVDLTHTYDRSGNRLTRYDGRPGARMPNWEFEYGYDGLDRLAEGRRGSWDGSTFTAAAGTQEWALDLLGNWATFRHDRNGDGDFNDSSEVEDRTHNAANEVASAAIQGLGGSPFAQRHDHAGNWTRSVRSGALRRDYVHDAWNRLVKATDDTQPATVRGEYEYNGLHWRTVKRLPESSTTAERRLFYSASWQVLEERIDDDVDEGFEADRVAQQVWGVRYIDDAVLRRTDANADGDYVDEGDRTDYYLTDAQFSVVAVVGPTGALRERVVYSPYGEARHHWPADLDGDGDVDSTDLAWWQNSANLVGIGHANYNPDADLNRDGVVGTQDIILALNWNGKAALAAGLISDPSGPDSPVGYCGYVFNAETGLYTVRFRHYDPVWGRWVERDPAEYVDGMSLYEYVRSIPALLLDRDGQLAYQGEPPSTPGTGLIGRDFIIVLPPPGVTTLPTASPGTGVIGREIIIVPPPPGVNNLPRPTTGGAGAFWLASKAASLVPLIFDHRYKHQLAEEARACYLNGGIPNPIRRENMANHNIPNTSIYCAESCSDAFRAINHQLDRYREGFERFENRGFFTRYLHLRGGGVPDNDYRDRQLYNFYSQLFDAIREDCMKHEDCNGNNTGDDLPSDSARGDHSR